VSRQLVPRTPRWRPTARAQWGLAGVGALLLATALVWHSAYAGLADATSPISLGVSTGTVALTDDDAGTALFSVTGLKPGATGTSCVAVTSSGTAPATVKLYRASGTTAKSLAYYLDLTVSAGTGGGTPSCGGFVAASDVYSGTLPNFPTTYGTAVDTWKTAGTPGGETRTYRFTYTLSASAPTSSAGGTASVAFSWEAQTR
jgi:hypothetical protein